MLGQQLKPVGDATCQTARLFACLSGVFWDYVESGSEAQMSIESEAYNDWCLPHIYDDCSPSTTPRMTSNLLFGCVSAATVLKNAFVLVQVNRFQQIIGVYTLQAPSYGNKVNILPCVVYRFRDDKVSCCMKCVRTCVCMNVFQTSTPAPGMTPDVVTPKGPSVFYVSDTLRTAESLSGGGLGTEYPFTSRESGDRRSREILYNFLGYL